MSFIIPSVTYRLIDIFIDFSQIFLLPIYNYIGIPAAIIVIITIDLTINLFTFVFLFFSEC